MVVEVLVEEEDDEDALLDEIALVAELELVLVAVVELLEALVEDVAVVDALVEEEDVEDVVVEPVTVSVSCPELEAWPASPE